MYLLAYFAISFLLIRFCLTLWNFISYPVIKYTALAQQPFLSILIPARNEAHNLPHLFGLIDQINYHNYELIVLDDHSEDNTASILEKYAKKWDRFTYLTGKELPEFWLGKNWACHQLAIKAKGDYLLFMDADIAEIHPLLCQYTIATAQQKKLALLSIFPQQQMKSFSERVVVPIMHYLLLSLLPLNWILHLPFPSMAAANGQFMLFDAEIYRRFQWHKQVKTTIVEDIAIMRKLKKSRLRGMTYLSKGMISCRMYKSYREGIDGFSKNILAGFGNSMIGITLYLVLILLAWPFIIWYFPYEIWLPLLGLILLIRAIISLLARESIFHNLWMHPIHMVSLLVISYLSIYKKITKRNIWKGRNVAK